MDINIKEKYKKGYKSKILILVSIIFLIIYFYYYINKQKDRYYNMYEKVYKQLVKQKSYYITYTKWMQLIQARHSISEYFNSSDRVAVYGMGKLGENICKDLAANNINLVYGIDKNNIGTNKATGLPVYAPDSILPEADCIVISVTYLADEITEESGISSCVKIITIDELIEKILNSEEN